MKITVTKEHIKKGIQKSSYKCPIALACEDALGIKLQVIARLVLFQDTGFTEPYFKLSKRAYKWYMKYDNGFKVKPMTFIMKRMPK